MEKVFVCLLLSWLQLSHCHEEITCGKLYYRTLYLDEKSNQLYVGAMDRLMRLDAGNITNSDCERDTMHLEPNNVANCAASGRLSREYDCRNHIRVIQPIGNDGTRLYICGTNSYMPKDMVIYSNLTKLARHEFYPGIGDGVAKCPFDPEDNSTAIWVESGNPGGHPTIYSGTNAEITKADSVIFRGDIFDANTGRREYTFKRTIKYDSHMLDKPDFVGSYEVGEHVYFFFREMAVEYMNCGRTVYSRVARVCKKDTGGQYILQQNWATYLKVRLNCSIPGEFPFFFDEIQHVYKPDYDDSTFHAVFTTSSNGLGGSAICSFSLKDIEKAFNGKFNDQPTSTSMWLPVAKKDVPDPRPGSCVPDTRSLPDTVLNFIRKHPLMDGDVPHDNHGPPMYYARDLVFTKIAADLVTVNVRRYSTEEFTVYYAGTQDGKVYKVARWEEGPGKFKSKLLDLIPATGGEAVRAIAISRENKMLYVTSDSVIKQFRIPDLCVNHKNCPECAADPYCGWNSEVSECQSYKKHLVQDASGKVDKVCEAVTRRERLTATFGSSLHLACKAHGFGNKVEWFHEDHDGREHQIFAQEDSYQKYVLTQNNGLVVIGMSEVDAGKYECRVDGDPVSRFSVIVDMARCSAPNKTSEYQKVYAAWCNEYQKYKTALKTWEKKRSQCPNKDYASTNAIYQDSGRSPVF